MRTYSWILGKQTNNLKEKGGRKVACGHLYLPIPSRISCSAR